MTPWNLLSTLKRSFHMDTTMQAMRSLSVLFAALLLGATFTACDLTEPDDRTLQEDPKLGWEPLTQFVEEGDVEDAGGTLTVTPDIQLIAPQRDSDLTVDFEVADSTTAVEGTHYTLSSTSATISANTSTAEVSIDVLDNDADDGGEVYELFLVLQSSEDVEPAENFKTYTLTLEGEDEGDEG